MGRNSRQPRNSETLFPDGFTRLIRNEFRNNTTERGETLDTEERETLDTGRYSIRSVNRFALCSANRGE